MEIKKKIKKKSLELFNDKGSRNISTNQIAKSMPISPGTLYYHYQNKEEIIRDLFKEMTTMYEEVYFSGIDFSNENMLMEKLILEDFSIAKKFNFFNYEIFTLIKKDPVLKKLNEEFIEKSKGQLYMLFKILQNQGLLKKNIKEQTIKKIIELMYFNSTYNIFINFDSDKSKEDIVIQKMIVLYSTLSEEGKNILKTKEKLFN